MAETPTSSRALAIKNSQDQILEVLGKIGDELDELVKIGEAESRVQNVQQLVGDIRDIVISFGERFTGAAEPIELVHQIKFEELFGDQDLKNAKSEGSGAFGKVYLSQFRGQKVAVKMQNIKEASMKKEIAMLRTISHDNIIGFRGWGKYNDELFLVMEHLDKNLLTYVNEQSSDDNKGLSSRITWEIAKQISQVMLYLHSLEIVHADLKPDNILVDTKPIIPKPKLCDFGLSRHDNLDQSVPSDEVPKAQKRFRPNVEEYEEAKTMNDLLKFDVFAFGLVVVHMRTGISPYFGYDTGDLKAKGVSRPLIKTGGKYFVRRIELPPDLPATVLGDIIKETCKNSSDRPTFREICDEYFGKDMKNPFNLSEKGEFFECGFLKDTQIFVADSMVEDTESTDYKPEGPPPGYRSEDLICAVEVEDAPYHDKPEEVELLDKYRTFYKEFRDKAKKKEIDDNPALALVSFLTDRSGDDEAQKIELRMKQKTYCHHRAMREIWKGFEPKEKKSRLETLSQVNEIYSTSFGLHVAILTNEGPRKTKKFVFTRRSNRPGVAAPGSYTCGAVESCSVKDYLSADKVHELVSNADPKKEYVSLINTAARGLEEELGLPLKGSDKDAITLNTVYLKFDFHEWGMCGFVDLTNEKIRKEHQFSFKDLTAAFTAGPKDRFEHWQIHGVDFELRTMVEWIRKNHDKLASSAKIVVVKVMQAFFGVAAVANEFGKKM